jgi:CopG antitoxin of type II toxin-antitoxin system
MATTKTRINISLPDDVKAALVQTADREGIPVATKAERLLEVALELEEDQVWDELASKRDTKDAHFLTSDEAFNI